MWKKEKLIHAWVNCHNVFVQIKIYLSRRTDNAQKLSLAHTVLSLKTKKKILSHYCMSADFEKKGMKSNIHSVEYSVDPDQLADIHLGLAASMNITFFW